MRGVWQGALWRNRGRGNRSRFHAVKREDCRGYFHYAHHAGSRLRGHPADFLPYAFGLAAPRRAGCAWPYEPRQAPCVAYAPYISVMRGTPAHAQMFFIYFAPYYLFGMDLSTDSKFNATIVAFIINYAAYFAEIYRSGIQSIPRSQYEAAEVLGYSRVQTFMKIVLPQVIKRILPAMGNEIITLVKTPRLHSPWRGRDVLHGECTCRIAGQHAAVRLCGRILLGVQLHRRGRVE